MYMFFTCVCTCMCVTHSVFVTSVTCLTHSIPSPPLPFIADWCCKFCARLRARISERNLFRSTSLWRSPTYNSPVSFKDSLYLRPKKKFTYVMTCLIKDRLCIKMTFMHNDCRVNYYEKCSRHWHICLSINQTHLIFFNTRFYFIFLTNEI